MVGGCGPRQGRGGPRGCFNEGQRGTVKEAVAEEEAVARLLGQLLTVGLLLSAIKTADVHY